MLLCSSLLLLLCYICCVMECSECHWEGHGHVSSSPDKDVVSDVGSPTWPALHFLPFNAL